MGHASGTTMALVIHELATNSAKYGALSSARGTLDVSCTAHEDEVVVMWTERGGPPVTAPSVPEGFGSKLVHRTVAAQLAAPLHSIGLRRRGRHPPNQQGPPRILSARTAQHLVARSHARMLVEAGVVLAAVAYGPDCLSAANRR